MDIALIKRGLRQGSILKNNTQVIIIGIKRKKLLILLHLLEIYFKKRLGFCIIGMQKAVGYQRIVFRIHIDPIFFDAV